MNNVRKKIMMVDDDLVILKIGRQFLKDKYEVFPLPTAEKLFTALEKVIPDVILLDVFMPEVNGVEVIKRLKTDVRYAGIPVIFVSSANDDQSVFEQFKLGAYSTLSKPFSADEIIDCIENCLSDRSLGNFQNSSKENDEYGKKIIVAVDDAPDTLRMVNSLLRDIYKVYTLTDPEELETFLQKTTPDLFLLDYRMPKLSGTDLIPIIRKFPENKDTPIVFLTSEKSPDFLKEAVKLGASDFIIKPVSAETLREKIAMHI